MIALQNELSLCSNRNDVGKTVDVLVEGYSKRSHDDMYGRTPQNKVSCSRLATPRWATPCAVWWSGPRVPRS